jgi:hypothetical protein
VPLSPRQLASLLGRSRARANSRRQLLSPVSTPGRRTGMAMRCQPDPETDIGSPRGAGDPASEPKAVSAASRSITPSQAKLNWHTVRSEPWYTAPQAVAGKAWWRGRFRVTRATACCPHWAGTPLVIDRRSLALRRPARPARVARATVKGCATAMPTSAGRAMRSCPSPPWRRYESYAK